LLSLYHCYYISVYKSLHSGIKDYKKDHRRGVYYTSMHAIDLFILKNMGAAIIDFRVCPPFVKCQNIMFSGFILFSYAWKATKKQKRKKSACSFLSSRIYTDFVMKLKSKYINYNIHFLKLLLYDLKWSNNDKKCA
jgi:hypothetical protein